MSVVFPLFRKQGDTQDVPVQPFRWIEPALGDNRTCLRGINLSPKPSPQIAAFDLDGCLIQSSLGKGSKGSPPSFTWWRPVVPKKLKELHEEGYAFVRND